MKLIKIIFLIFIICISFNAKSFCSEKTFPINLGETGLNLEIAIDPLEQAKGLMFRLSMPTYNGMIFVYDKPQQANFWMKNTFIFLDIAFFTKDGILREIKTMKPHDLTTVSSTRDDIFYVLEMNKDFFKKEKITIGQKLDLEKLNQAIKEKSLSLDKSKK